MSYYYRNHIVKVGDKQHGGVATPPKCLKDIQTLMSAYVDWLASGVMQKQSPIIQAALAHYHLACIHPFGDGNGRTARLVEAALLNAAGVKYLPTMLSNYYYREIDTYFMLFSACRRSKTYDVTPFVSFVLQGVIDSLNEVKNRITTYLRESALKEYFQSLRETKNITARQFEFLNLLLAAPATASVTLRSIQQELPYRTLYATVSDRTARRDLEKLQGLHLITITENQYQLDRQILNAL